MIQADKNSNQFGVVSVLRTSPPRPPFSKGASVSVSRYDDENRRDLIFHRESGYNTPVAYVFSRVQSSTSLQSPHLFITQACPVSFREHFIDHGQHLIFVPLQCTVDSQIVGGVDADECEVVDGEVFE